MAHKEIVGLTGKKRAGKDTFGGVLCDEFEYTRVAFADPLREAALGLDPIIDWELPGSCCGERAHDECDTTGGPIRLSTIVERVGWEAAKDTYPEVRRTLERLGTDAIRALAPDFWVRIAAQRIEAAPGSVVITDVRFPNEADKVRELGGVVARVVRTGQAAEEGAHVSDTAMDDYETDFEFKAGNVGALKDSATAFAATLPFLAKPVNRID